MWHISQSECPCPATAFAHCCVSVCIIPARSSQEHRERLPSNLHWFDVNHGLSRHLLECPCVWSLDVKPGWGLHYPTLPYSALPYLTLSYHTLPYPSEPGNCGSGQAETVRAPSILLLSFNCSPRWQWQSGAESEEMNNSSGNGVAYITAERASVF